MKKILFGLMAVAALTACNNDEDFAPVNTTNEIRVNATINQMTRVTTDGLISTFDVGDCIQVYGWTGNWSGMSNISIKSANTLQDNGAWEAQPQMLWQNQTSKHYFVGIYPVREVANLRADAYVLDEANQEEADLLVAVSDAAGLLAMKKNVDLAFKHVMAKLNINLYFRTEFGDVAPVPNEVKLYCGKETTVDYLLKSVSANKYDYNEDIYITMPALTTPVTGYGASYSSIAVPQEGVRCVDIVIGDKTYRYEGSNDIPLVSGTITTLNLNVGKDKVTLADVSVDNWENGDSIGNGEAEEIINYPYVDFGLTSGTLWATYNLGASAPEEFGAYFAWGETQPKETYNWSKDGDYKYGIRNTDDKIDGGMTKYNSTDNLLTLESSDDAAHVNWGGDWRTPTKADYEELIEACNAQWTDNYNDTGVTGVVLTSKTDETKFIFLPAAGYYTNQGYFDNGTHCKFWCSSVYETEYPAAWSLNVQNDMEMGMSAVIGANPRNMGLSIRPVRVK